MTAVTVLAVQILCYYDQRLKPSDSRDHEGKDLVMIVLRKSFIKIRSVIIPETAVNGVPPYPRFPKSVKLLMFPYRLSIPKLCKIGYLNRMPFSTAVFCQHSAQKQYLVIGMCRKDEKIRLLRWLLPDLDNGLWIRTHWDCPYTAKCHSIFCFDRYRASRRRKRGIFVKESMSAKRRSLVIFYQKPLRRHPVPFKIYPLHRGIGSDDDLIS